MKYVNRYGLPDAFFRAVTNDKYNSGDSDFTATSLAVPPRAAQLIKKYNDVLEVDVSTRVAALIGQGTHSIVERAARPDIDICEKRFFSDFLVDGKLYKVSAQIDLFDGDDYTLYDWKTCKSYAFHRNSGGGKKPEWQWQLNVAAEIMRRNDFPVKALKIIGLLKDWQKSKALEPGYPPLEVATVELKMWSREDCNLYVADCIRGHVAAKTILPQCTSVEAWGGRKCSGGWCDAAPVCSQYKRMKDTGLFKQGDEE